jgi:preprotein translocase subunit SecE
VGRLQRKKTGKKKKKTTVSAENQTQTARKKDEGSKVTAEPGKENKGTKPAAAPVAVKRPSGVTKPAPTGPKDNLLTRSIQFLREVKVELKKVTWPTRKQTLGSTVVVLVLVSIIAFFLGAVDIGLSSLVKLVLR